jgi:enoyl-CoA hydratase
LTGHSEWEPGDVVVDGVRVECSGSIMTITIDRPGVHNAIDAAAAEAICQALDTLDERPDLLAGIITGAGGTFCAGMDLKAFGRGERPVTKSRGFAGIAARPPRTPIVAAVEGFAVGGGWEVALACDLVVASRQATFGLPEVTRGFVAGGGGALRLPRRLPYHLAMELILTGRTLTALQAHQFGLVNQLTSTGGALDAARDLAAAIAMNAPLAVTASKQLVVESQDWSVAEAFERQEAIIDPVRRSVDAAEGARAFAEKRAPVWQAR